MNYKGGILQAFKQFSKDLQLDYDFIQHKVKCHPEENTFYHVTTVSMSKGYNTSIVNPELFKEELNNQIAIT